MKDRTAASLSSDEISILRSRHPIHELVTCGCAGLEDRIREVRQSLAHERSRFLLDTVAEASRTDHHHLVDIPLGELLRDADEVLKWTVLTFLAVLGYRPAQIEVATRCAAESYFMAALRDVARGRTFNRDDRRLLTRALNDAEWMMGYAAGWGAIANGKRSENRREETSLTEHAKDLGLEVTAGLWAAVATDAWDGGYQEGYATGSSGPGKGAKDARPTSTHAIEVGCNDDAASRVVVPHSNLPLQEGRMSGVGDIVGKALPLVKVCLLAEKSRSLCESAWNKDPVLGVIGVQTGPL